MNKQYHSIACYILLAATIIALFYINQFYVGSGFILAILCSVFSFKPKETIITGLLSILALTVYFLTRPDSFSIETISKYSVFMAAIIISIIILLYYSGLKKDMLKYVAELEALFNHATIGILVWDVAGEIVNFNKHAEHIFGYQSQEIIGNPVDLLFKNPVKPSNQNQSFLSHQSTPLEYISGLTELDARNKNGKSFPLEVSYNSYKGENGVNVIAFVTDITVRRRNERIVLEQREELEKTSSRIRQMNEELETKVEKRTEMLNDTLAELEKSKQELVDALEKEKQLNDLKSRFVTITSHEFRTPLSTILSSADLLEKYNSNSMDQLKTERHIRKIKGSVSSIKNILEDIITLDKMENGAIHVSMKWMNPDECLKKIKETIHNMQLLAKPDQCIDVSFLVETPVFIDIALVQNILANLLSNAVKFSSEGQYIEVELYQTERGMGISIKDEGIGIPDDEQPHIFERFFRAYNAVDTQGTGLGLHIVKKYVELMNGSVIIESSLNEGTAVHISIPQPELTPMIQIT